MMRCLAPILLLAAAGAAEHPLAKDATGIRWVHPFEKALARAKAEHRMILFLPLAGGTDAAGNW